MSDNFIMHIILCIPLILFGTWSTRKAVNKYKLKSYYDFQMLGAGLGSIIIGVYFLYSVISDIITAL
ncbi:hypothetical protein [Winogradskyella sp. SM1960]|uniref:hypothetical protein n=1 Tax=Winogradskyella sp. SM1960 TaxID=2865955 RepID=UPI001CD4EEA0|nr:hypothetical protein [Winogradskyella sp. SM1960]